MLNNAKIKHINWSLSQNFFLAYSYDIFALLYRHLHNVRKRHFPKTKHQWHLEDFEGFGYSDLQSIRKLFLGLTGPGDSKFHQQGELLICKKCKALFQDCISRIDY